MMEREIWLLPPGLSRRNLTRLTAPRVVITLNPWLCNDDD